MRFSLLHPSRRRLTLAARAIDEWREKASGQHALEYLLSVDADDPDLEGYRKLAENRDVRLLVGENRSIVDATNRAARASSGDVLVVVSDDFGCPEAWDETIADLLGEDLDRAVWVADGIDNALMTLPILGRRFYESLGYVYHPDYLSMYADDELTEVARSRRKVIDARHVQFEHRHYSKLGTRADSTYRRQNSERAYLDGWRVFERHRAKGFSDEPKPAAWPRIARVEALYWARRIAAGAGLSGRGERNPG
ncbi:MAG: hypothetical protein JRH10_10660 [Deltaproteobacteria bacterium]|nr:hypothetical protein [Deltaproteobacteria bacterium]